MNSRPKGRKYRNLQLRNGNRILLEYVDAHGERHRKILTTPDGKPITDWDLAADVRDAFLSEEDFRPMPTFREAFAGLLGDGPSNGH